LVRIQTPTTNPANGNRVAQRQHTYHSGDTGNCVAVQIAESWIARSFGRRAGRGLGSRHSAVAKFTEPHRYR